MRALEAKKVRRERRLMVVEGEDLLEAALDRGVRPAAVLVDAARASEIAGLLDRLGDLDERYAVPADLMARSATLATAPRVIAVLPQPGPAGFRDVAWPPVAGLWLGGVSDPGNVGTLVRSAAGLGADWVALGPGSADPFHPRAVRAAMGATFTLPLLEGVRADDLATREGFAVVVADAADGVPPWDADLTGPVVIALGAERTGHDEALNAVLGAGGLEVRRVRIPQAPGTESLNVAAAGAVLLAEALRQRSTSEPGHGRPVA
ncbi:MAG: RNA methyltransferase [Thermoleophilia bacterium]|nr:RNA methyltransferase [Thermoleophilia bacterium]